MTNFETFKSGETLTTEQRAKLSPEDRKRYDLEQKIRGLMRKADDSRTPEAERDNATRMISKLIAKHQIDLALLRQETGGASGPVKIVDFSVMFSNRFNLGGIRARAILRAVVNPLGGKGVYWHYNDSTKIDTRLLVFLPEDVVDFAKMLIASLTLQVETSMKVATVQHVRELRSQWVSKNEETRLVSAFRKGYLLSWGNRVGSRVSAGREDARQEAVRETGKELALLDTKALADKALEDWNEARGFKTRAARAVYVSADGQTAGRRDGSRAQLGINEVGGTRRRALAG